MDVRSQDHEGHAGLIGPTVAHADAQPQPPRESGAVVVPEFGGAVVLAAQAMATRFELVLAGLPEADLRAAGEEALDEITSLHARLSAFEPGSVVSRLNSNAAAGPMPVAGDVFALLSLCRDIWRASGGVFDPTVGPLMEAWGFRARAGETWRPPTDEALARVRTRVGMHLVELDDAARTVRYTVPDVRLDLGSVAKGWALDAAAIVLREHGVSSAFLHGGTSSVVTLGAPPGEDAWHVEVRGLPNDRARVAMRDQALGVSAGHGREVVVNGAVLGHVLDPRTGHPARGARVAAVTGPSAALADAWSTAALVAGGTPAGLPEGYAAVVV